MIYTVTLNPAMDKTVLLPEFAPGQVNRVQSVREDAGGKGVNVSKCLKALGEPSVAVVLLAGYTGRRLSALLEGEGISLLQVWSDGETRTNVKIIDPVQEQNTDINDPGLQADEGRLTELLEKLMEQTAPGDIVVLSGSLPGGVSAQTYACWTEALSRNGIKVFLDADGEAMALGLNARPHLIKPNEAELSRALGRNLQTVEELVSAGKALQAEGIARVVISLGCNGALFLLEDGVYQADCLQVPVKSTVGAGDAMVAALAYAESRGLTPWETIRLAMAMGAASVMQEGSNAPEEQLVRQLEQQVVIRIW